MCICPHCTTRSHGTLEPPGPPTGCAGTRHGHCSLQHEGWRSLSRDSLHARATRSSSIDELSEARARSCSKPRELPLKSESLQKDRRSVRYNRYDGVARYAKRLSPLSTGDFVGLCASERGSARFELRGHCRVAYGPIVSAHGSARRAIGALGAPLPAPRQRSGSKTRTLRRAAAKVARAAARLRAAARWSGTPHAAPVASHYQNIFGDGTRVNLNTESSSWWRWL